MPVSKFLVSVFILVVVLTCIRCTRENAALYTPWKINLRWIPSYEEESWDDVRTGLLWSFSFLGASLPTGSFDASVTWVNDQIFTCDFSKLGFNDDALLSLQVIFDRLKASEEYKSKGGIDLGRLLMLTIYSSNHYYRITGTNQSYSTVKELYLSDSVLQFGITNSAVATDDRLIHMPEATNPSAIAFYSATEGTGKITDSSFSIGAYEIFELMPNGQLRFAIYDSQGKLETSADALISAAGKPGKCMWCHESNVQTLFSQMEDVPGYLTSQEFIDRVKLSNDELKAIRNELSTDLVFANNQDHTQSELLYIGFMEPSAYRIAHEWDISLPEAESILSGLPVHDYPEFPFLGVLYDRIAVDLLSPYETERVPESAREYSSYEPDFF
ncbi:MAG TPA: hypothetical protein PLD84_02890 [Chitinophagales bacterium]|nr:hypothetical protein [Chitinophagales bacterium]